MCHAFFTSPGDALHSLAGKLCVSYINFVPADAGERQKLKCAYKAIKFSIIIITNNDHVMKAYAEKVHRYRCRCRCSYRYSYRFQLHLQLLKCRACGCVK